MSAPTANPLDRIYDIESYVNVTTLAAKHPLTGDRWLFELSNRRDDRQALFQWLSVLRSTRCRMVGFNNVSFDYPVIHWLLAHPTASPLEINRFVQSIIDIPHDQRFNHIIWDRDRYVEQVDLFKIHHFDNVARATSLKVIEFNRRSHTIKDLPFPPGSYLTDSQIDELIIYNQHDVDETEGFYFDSLPAIRFREELSEKYGRNFLNDNDTKIGKQYFIMRLEEAAPGACYTTDAAGNRVPRQTKRDSIDLGSVIFPWISFKRPEFQAVHQWLAAQTITETKGVFVDIPVVQLGPLAQYSNVLTKRTGWSGVENLNCVVNGFQFDFGTGGIHGSVTNRVVRSDDQYVIRDIDVTSYYPCLGIKNKLFPLHLGELFPVIYEDVFDQRTGYAKGTAENAMLKLALNGVYGDSNNKFSPFYDPAYTMAITINGQLLLCLLAEHLMDIPDLEMIQVNTDGVTVRLPRTAVGALESICGWWQSHTMLTLEHADYDLMAVRDGNNYLAVKPGGKVKRKGAYEWERVQNGGTLGWHQNHSALVVPMAAETALVDGVPVRDYVLNHDDLMDFMLRVKVPRSSSLVLCDGAGGERPLQHVTRYYVSKSGGSLVKIMPPLARTPDKVRRIGVSVGWAVQEANSMDGVRGTDINMEYYINEAEKLVRPLQGER